MGACFIGYIVQAIAINFLPLLYVMFQTKYNITLGQISLLIIINFAVQLCIDAFVSPLVLKLGYRISAIFAHAIDILGFALLMVLPTVMDNTFLALVLAVVCYSIGGGFIEVIVSPIVEACPNDNKKGAMSLLHSFYCWGQAGVVLLSTIFFLSFGLDNWRIMAGIWIIVPLINIILFSISPIPEPYGGGHQKGATKKLFKNKLFWILVLIMMCAGSSEISVAQWVSAFAEESLKVSKTIGDLVGAMLFAVAMGITRVLFGKFGKKINLNVALIVSAGLCVFSYLIISLVPVSIIGLIGCVICGVSVGIMWPGSLSLATETIKDTGPVIFAYLAIAGDVGCTLGPIIIGNVAEALNNNLKMGILSATIFPFIMLFAVIGYYLHNKKSKKQLQTLIEST